jgi:large subunit ribosomal protein L17
MRHGNKGNKLSRTASHRRALLANLGCQLITYKRITTTLAKAKALRTYIEPLITKTKATDSQEAISHNHRIVFSYLNDKYAVKELFTVVAPKVAGRPGGYTRIIKLGARVGDNAELAMIELVDFNEVYGKHIAGTTAEPAKRTRRSGSKKKATGEDESTATETATEDAKEAPKAAKKKAAKGDDLKLVEGVGPKAAEAFVAAGIVTFADMAAATPEKLKEILDASDGTFNAADTTTWPEQAQLAADGKMDELKEFQDKLKGGREA